MDADARARRLLWKTTGASFMGAVMLAGAALMWRDGWPWWETGLTSLTGWHAVWTAGRLDERRRAAEA